MTEAISNFTVLAAKAEVAFLPHPLSFEVERGATTAGRGHTASVMTLEAKIRVVVNLHKEATQAAMQGHVNRTKPRTRSTTDTVVAWASAPSVAVLPLAESASLRFRQDLGGSITTSSAPGAFRRWGL